MKIRAFLAVPVSSEVRANAARLMEKLAARTSGVDWTAPDNLHITLKFFGDIKVESTHEISRAAQETVDEMKPFEIEVGGAGAFPNTQRPRTVWLGVTDGESEFNELAGQLEDRFHDLGYAPERRRFQPHLTIGRVRNKQGNEELSKLLSELKECFIGPMYVDELVLFSSQFERQGLVYSRMATIEF